MYGNILQNVSQSLDNAQSTAFKVQSAIEETSDIIDSYSFNDKSSLTPQQQSIFSQRFVPIQQSSSLTPQQEAAISKRFQPDETSNLQKVLMIGIPIGLGIIGYKFLFSKKKRRR